MTFLNANMAKLTMLNVSGTQNMACTTAWLTMYLTASGPADKQKSVTSESLESLNSKQISKTQITTDS